MRPVRLPARVLRPLAIGLLAVSLTACGSTVQADDTSLQRQGGLLPPGTTVAPDGTVVDELGNPVATDDAGNPLPDLADGVDTNGGGAPVVPGTDGTADPGADPSAQPVAPDRDPLGESAAGGVIEIGVPYTAAGGNAALGAGAFTTGDGRANGQAMIDYVNSQGGIGGRMLKPVYFVYDATSAETVAAQDSAACSRFFEDNDVSIVWGGGVSRTFFDCAAKKGALVFNNGRIMGESQEFYDDYPQTYTLSTITAATAARGIVASFARTGYYGEASPRADIPADTKIGVLTYATEPFKSTVEDVLLPALKAAGHPVDPDDIFYARQGQTTSSVGETASDANSAALRFAANRVTHVISFDLGATLTLLFLRSTANQSYYPRMGVGSGAGMQALLDAGYASGRQFEGASGFGWLPSIDLPRAKAATYRSSAATKCLATMKRAGQVPDSANAETIMLSDCDNAFLTLQALGPLKTLSLQAAIDAIDALGTRYVSPTVDKTRFGPGLRAPTATGFDMVYDAGCNCAKYARSYDIR